MEKWKTDTHQYQILRQINKHISSIIVSQFDQNQNQNHCFTKATKKEGQNPSSFDMVKIHQYK